ncbi:MAG TPA: hypothetical protein ENI27_04540 [bacterium]|nr:hypothetical protein [bacterium]
MTENVSGIAWGESDTAVIPALISFGENDAPPPISYGSADTPVEDGSFLPRFVQEGYNRSLTGLGEQIATGKQRYDLSGYELSTLEDIGATVASFLMPVDFLLTLGTGGLASLPAKALAKRTAAQLVKSGIRSRVAREAAVQGVSRAVQGASVLGVYSGSQSALAQKAEFGEIDLAEVTKATLRGTVLGAIAGGVGGSIAGRTFAKTEIAAARNIARSTAVNVRDKAVEVGGEVIAFGTAAPAIEGRLPTGEDYAHAAGVILGLRSVHVTASKGFKALRKGIARDLKAEVEGGASLENATETVGERLYVGMERPITEPGKVLKVKVGGEEITFDEYRALRDRAPLNQEDVLRQTIQNETVMQKEALSRGDKESAASHERTADELHDRLVRVQSERATEPVQAADPSEMPLKGQPLGEIFAKQEAEIAATNKFSPSRAYAELKRGVVDVRGNVRQKLLREGGDAGREVVVKFDTVAGASSWAKLEYARAEKEIFTLSPPEETLLARVIQAKRSIELDRIYDKRGEPRLAHTEGHGKESLDAALTSERAIRPEAMERIEASADIYFKEMRGQLDQLFESGLLTKESYQKLLEYQHYSPRRFIQHLDPDRPSFDVSGNPISVSDRGLKMKLPESTRIILDIWVLISGSRSNHSLAYSLSMIILACRPSNTTLIAVLPAGALPNSGLPSCVNLFGF